MIGKQITEEYIASELAYEVNESIVREVVNPTKEKVWWATITTRRVGGQLIGLGDHMIIAVSNELLEVFDEPIS